MNEQQIKAAAREWATDYKPWEDNLSPQDYARHGFEQGMIAALRPKVTEEKPARTFRHPTKPNREYGNYWSSYSTLRYCITPSQVTPEGTQAFHWHFNNGIECDEGDIAPDDSGWENTFEQAVAKAEEFERRFIASNPLESFVAAFWTGASVRGDGGFVGLFSSEQKALEAVAAVGGQTEDSSRINHYELIPVSLNRIARKYTRE